jgi:hypothetical protein
MRRASNAGRHHSALKLFMGLDERFLKAIFKWFLT